MALMTRVRDRLAAVGLQPPTVTVRYQDVTVQSKVGVGSNELPSIMDPIKDRLQPILNPLSAASGRPPSSIYRQHTILASVSGILKPGVFTVLLGPPRSSKTTFLRTLAGLNRRTPGLRTTAKELTYNGHEFSEFVVERSAAYITQDDVAHFSELTVRETLEFSARCQSTGHRRKLLEELAEREEQRGIHPDPDLDAYMRGMYYGGKHALIVEIIIRLLGLDVCADTVVGGAMMRGISGGQRKRVTTGEMIVGPARALFADEISTGESPHMTLTVPRISLKFNTPAALHNSIYALWVCWDPENSSIINARKSGETLFTLNVP